MLTDRDRAMLDLEAGWWKQQGAKENVIATEFGLTPVRYYQVLNRLIDDPYALVYAPTVVSRLRRIRERGSGSLSG